LLGMVRDFLNVNIGGSPDLVPNISISTASRRPFPDHVLDNHIRLLSQRVIFPSPDRHLMLAPRFRPWPPA
jgi:hypothetical protein